VLVWRFPYSSAVFTTALLVGIGTFAAFSYWRFMQRPALDVGAFETALVQQLRDSGGRFLYADWLWNPDISAARARTLGMRSVNWYGPLIPVRAKELLGMAESGAIRAETLGSDNVALDLYGVRFAAIRAGVAVKLGEAKTMLAPRWERLGTEKGTTFYRNDRALPLGWLCPAWRSVSSSEAVAAIQNAAGHDFDPRREALVEELPSGGEAGADVGVADVAWEGSATLRARVDTASPAFLVVSVNGLPGWSATVDGAPRPVYRTDYALLGIPVEAGRHEVVLRYRVPAWQWAVPWTGALAAILCVVRLPRRRSFPEDGVGRRH
jgi:hypothetical protein